MPDALLYLSLCLLFQPAGQIEPLPSQPESSVALRYNQPTSADARERVQVVGSDGRVLLRKLPRAASHVHAVQIRLDDEEDPVFSRCDKQFAFSAAQLARQNLAHRPPGRNGFLTQYRDRHRAFCQCDWIHETSFGRCSHSTAENPGFILPLLPLTPMQP